MPPTLRHRLGLLLVAAPLGLQALFVYALGVNTLLGDEFLYTGFIREVLEGRSWLHWLWAQHNEHRVIPMKLAMALLAPWTRWSTVAEMYVSVALAGLVVWGLWRLDREHGGGDLVLFAPAAWLVCSLAQFHNMLYGMMMCHYFTLVGVVWALVFLSRRGSAALTAAVFCGLLAELSIANGLLVWPAGLALLLVRGEPRARTLSWSAASLVASAVYFYHFRLPATTPMPALDPLSLYRLASYAVATLGAPLGAGSIDWCRAAGLAAIFLTGVAVWRWRRGGGEALRQGAPWGALILFSLLSCAMIAVGRVSYTVPPFESRYIAYSSFVWIGLWLALTTRPGSAPEVKASGSWRAGLAALLIPGLLAADLWGFREARHWTSLLRRERFLLQTFDTQPDEALGSFYSIVSVPELRERMGFLRTAGLGPFSEPPDLLLLTRWREGSAAAEVLPGRPLEQRFTCPVATLWEAGIVTTTFGRHNAGTLDLSLWDGTRRLGRRTVPAASLVDWAWLSLPLAAPLARCQGRELTLRLESADASPGNAVSAYTYPAHVSGEIMQAGVPAFAGRSLGLELNAFHFGVLE